MVVFINAQKKKNSDMAQKQKKNMEEKDHESGLCKCRERKKRQPCLGLGWGVWFSDVVQRKRSLGGQLTPGWSDVQDKRGEPQGGGIFWGKIGGGSGGGKQSGGTGFFCRSSVGAGDVRSVL